MLLLRLPKALDPTLVGTKLFLPTPPDLLRKSARRWVTQVAVLHALFCAVTLLFERKTDVSSQRIYSACNRMSVTGHMPRKDFPIQASRLAEQQALTASVSFANKL